MFNYIPHCSSLFLFSYFFWFRYIMEYDFNACSCIFDLCVPLAHVHILFVYVLRFSRFPTNIVCLCVCDFTFGVVRLHSVERWQQSEKFTSIKVKTSHTIKFEINLNVHDICDKNRSCSCVMVMRAFNKHK